MTAASDKLQNKIVLNLLKEMGLIGPDQRMPSTVRVKHGSNNQGTRIHYYLNYSSESATFTYYYGAGRNLLTNNSLIEGQLEFLSAIGASESKTR